MVILNGRSGKSSNYEILIIIANGRYIQGGFKSEKVNIKMNAVNIEGKEN
jgi:hypothetical protein